MEKPPKQKKKKKDKDKIGGADKQAEDNEEIIAHTTKKKKRQKNSEADTAEEQYTDSQGEHISDNHVHEESNAENIRKKHKKDKKKKSHKERETVNEGIGAESLNDSIASLTSCEPLFTSTQRDENINSGSQLHSFMNGGRGLIVDDTVDSAKNNRLMHDLPKQSKSRKRHHDDNSETYKLLSIAGLTTDLDLTMHSPVKKHKRHHKVNIEALQSNSSADFEDSYSSKQTKKKKKKKHKAE